MSEKRFTDVNVDFEESWIRLKDNGDFLIFPISFNDKEEYGLETLEDLLNGLSDKIGEQQATINRQTEQHKARLNKLIEENSELRMKIVVLEKELHIEGTDAQNRKESGEYWRDKCKELETQLNKIPENIKEVWLKND